MHRPSITVLMGTLLGTVVTVLVAWTKFRYRIGSPSFGTNSVGTIEAFLGRFPICSGRFPGKILPRKGFLGQMS
jgi:hypothetical protein